MLYEELSPMMMQLKSACYSFFCGEKLWRSLVRDYCNWDSREYAGGTHVPKYRSELVLFKIISESWSGFWEVRRIRRVAGV